MLEIIGSLVNIDRAIFFFINTSLANPVTDFIMPMITTDLHLKIFYGLCLALILWKGDNRLRIAILFSLAAIALTDQISASVIKPIFARPRPCSNLDVHLLVGCGSGFSFPSSHAANLFGQAYLFRVIKPGFAKFLIPLAIVVALSRVFVGVHYPIDIIVGAALGTIIGFCVGYIFIRLIDKKKMI